MNETETYNNALFKVDNEIGIYRAYDETGNLKIYEETQEFKDAVEVVEVFEKYPSTTF